MVSLMPYRVSLRVIMVEPRGTPYEHRMGAPLLHVLLHVYAPRHGVRPVGCEPGLQDRRQNICRAGARAGQGMAVVQMPTRGVCRVSRAGQGMAVVQMPTRGVCR